MSDWGLVMQLGQTRMFDTAAKILADPRVGQLFLGGTLDDAPAAA
jgi:branched-chain amino acid transport system ATP-binding protein